MRDIAQITKLLNFNHYEKETFVSNVCVAVIGNRTFVLFKGWTDTPDLAKENVAGTKWLGYDKSAGSMTLNFYKDGTYLLSFDYGGYSEGSYKQNGTAITFAEKSEWDFYYDFTRGSISYGGMTLTIPMYYYDGEYAKDYKFTLVNN